MRTNGTCPALHAQTKTMNGDPISKKRNPFVFSVASHSGGEVNEEDFMRIMKKAGMWDEVEPKEKSQKADGPPSDIELKKEKS